MNKNPQTSKQTKQANPKPSQKPTPPSPFVDKQDTLARGYYVERLWVSRGLAQEQ